MRCPYCNINNPAQNQTCFVCQKPLYSIQPAAIEENSVSPHLHILKGIRNWTYQFTLMFTFLKNKIQSWNEHFRFLSRPWLAGWLGLIPGLGQVYNGQIVKAITMFITLIVLLIGIYCLLYSYISNWLLYGLFCLIAYSFMDTFLANLKKHRKQVATFRQKLTTIFYGLFLFGSTISIGQWVLYPSMRFVYMNNNNLYPVIHHSDRVAINRMPYWFNKPKRGDMVWYESNSFDAIFTHPDGLGDFVTDTYVYTEGSNIERILALPGETIRFANNKISIDGKELPAEYMPLVDGTKPSDLTYTLPKETYFILMSKVPQWGDTISDSIVQYGVFKLFPPDDAAGALSPHKAYIGDTENWLKACVVKRDKIIGKAWFIYDPPPNRRFF